MNLSGAVNNLITSFVLWLPKLVGVIAILVIGFIIAWILKAIVTRSLRAAGVDWRLSHSPANNVVRRLTSSPSNAVGKLVYWLVAIVTITIAISAMNVPIFNQFIAGIYGYIPNILAAIVILGIALAASTAISGLIMKLMGDTPTGRIVSTVIPVVILSIAGFAILEQLKIAPTIVTITYAAILGALSLGFALAFGLGGREVAGDIFSQAYSKGRENMGQVRKDIQKGRERGKKEAEEQKRKFEDK